MREKRKMIRAIGAFWFVVSVMLGFSPGENVPSLLAVQTFYGDQITMDDFDRCQPDAMVLNDQSQSGYWNLRYATWGNKNLLNAGSGAPDLSYDPRLTGIYNIEVESRATNWDTGFGLKLTSDQNFDVIDVPNDYATETYHYNVWIPWRQNVDLTGEKIDLRKLADKDVYIINFKFTPIGQYTRLVNPGEGGSFPATGVIFKDYHYNGWPTIAKTASGKLIIVFSGSRDAHVCPWGKTAMLTSEDEGETWSDTKIINNTPLDDRDAGIVETSSGTLLVNWFTSTYFQYCMLPAWQKHFAKIGPETLSQWSGFWVRRSTNGGQTWGTPIQTSGYSPHGPIQLADGRLLYVQLNGYTPQVQQSTNDGVTWTTIATIPTPSTPSGSAYWDEPDAVECDSGKLVAMFRYEVSPSNPSSPRYLYQSESTNGGTTWSTIHVTPLCGYPPHLCRLDDGTLLVSYSHRGTCCGGYSERASFSYDDGVTWDTPIIVSSAPDSDFGYPSSVELSDGTILTVYYQKEQTSEKPCIMGTYWRREE